MKLSEYLDSNVLDNVQVRAVIRELAVRIERLERERQEDSRELLRGLCSCSQNKPSGVEHLGVCPQSRGYD